VSGLCQPQNTPLVTGHGMSYLGTLRQGNISYLPYFVRELRQTFEASSDTLNVIEDGGNLDKVGGGHGKKLAERVWDLLSLSTGLLEGRVGA